MDATNFEAMDWRIAFAYTDCDVSLADEYILPQMPWDDEIKSEGGNDEATSGEQESFVIREDEIREIEVRMTETEWATKMRVMLKTLWRQPQIFTVWFDVADVLSEHAVRLVEPWLSAKPTRSAFGNVLTIKLKLRTADGSAWVSREFFPALEDSE